MNAERFEALVLQGERYASRRARWRSEMVRLKKTRRVCLGSDVEVLFESSATLLFQLQEVLFIESVTSSKRVREAVEQHAALLPRMGRLVASVMLCRGGVEDALAFDGALMAGLLELHLFSFAAPARVFDDGDPTSPVRYVAFDDWFFRPSFESSGELRLPHRGGLTTVSLDEDLAFTLNAECAGSSGVAPRINSDPVGSIGRAYRFG